MFMGNIQVIAIKIYFIILIQGLSMTCSVLDLNLGKKILLDTIDCSKSNSIQKNKSLGALGMV